MANVSEKDAGRMYAWWLDGHSRPKNSKWLLENLSEVDCKVKQMLDIIDEDADSFARRAEMFYKKRPELMKLVEEFYSAYRGLATRYDHVTGLLRFDLRIMAEAYPRKPHSVRGSEMSFNFTSEDHPGFCDDGDIDRGSSGSSCGRKDGDSIQDCCSFTDLVSFENSEASKDIKSLERRARKSLKFEDDEVSLAEVGSAEFPLDYESVGELHLEILSLKAALSNLEAEKQERLISHQQCQEKLSDLELQLSLEKEESARRIERALRAEAVAQDLKESLENLDTHTRTLTIQNEQSLDSISILEKQLVQAEIDIVSLKAKNESSSVLYNESVKKMHKMDGELLQLREEIMRTNGRADEADKEVDSLMQTLAVLAAEKETVVAKDSNCLSKIAQLEHELKVAEEEVKLLHTKLEDKLGECKKFEDRNTHLERQNQSLQSDLERLSKKLADQSEELEVKQKELSNTLQTELEVIQMHEKMEELRAANTTLQTKVSQIKLHNKSLTEVNLSLALTVKDSKAEISNMKETIAKLEADIESMNVKNSSLKRELNDAEEELKSNHEKNRSINSQIESLGINPNCVAYDIQRLLDENARLRAFCDAFKEEKQGYLHKLDAMDNLTEQKISLESSLSHLKLELDCEGKKVKALEESCRGLQYDNSVLVSNNSFLVTQLQVANRNLEKLSQEKSCLEKAHLDANIELQELRGKPKLLEESCRFLESKVSSKDGEIEQLKNKLIVLEFENAKLRAQVGSYSGALASLKGSVATLENRSLAFTYYENNHVEEQTLLHKIPPEVSQVSELQTKIANIEKLMSEREKNLLLENSSVKTKLETTIKQLEDMKSKNVSRQQWSSAGKLNIKLSNDCLNTQNSLEKLEDGREVMTKDILLDETSESSVGFGNEPFEIWDSSFHKGSIDLTVEKAPKQSKKKLQRKRSHSFVDKEVTFDNLVVSRSNPSIWIETQDRKILDRLDADAQKLTKLHITIQELKKTTETTRKGDGEYEYVREQIEESEEAVVKLFNVILRLKRSVEAEAFTMEETSALAYEEKRGIMRRKASDQVRKMSEKIGRLHADVQKLQFHLIKLDEQSKSRPKIKISERKTRVLLRDYLYSSGTRGRQAPKRSTFCACAQPLTNGD